MRFFLNPLAALGVAALLSACALGPEGLEEESFTKVKADEILGAVEGTENRSARFALVAAAYSELAAERAMLDPGASQEIAGQMLRVERAIGAFSGVGPDSVFPETDLRRITLDLADVVSDVAVSRVRSLAANLVGGVNVAGLRERARILAVQAALTDSLIIDLRARVAEMSDGTATAEEIRAAAVARFKANQSKVESLL